jgi:sulfite exporter TauE/SafE
MVMAAFGVGTVPALSLAALGAGHLAQAGPNLRRALAVVVLASGWWSISTRAGLWAEPAVDGAPPCHASAPG